MSAKVFVCTDETDQSCQKCGTFNEFVGKKEWGVVSCSGDGIQGRFVKVMSAATTVLQITQIEIFGNRNIWFSISFKRILFEIFKCSLNIKQNASKKSLQKGSKLLI